MVKSTGALVLLVALTLAVASKCVVGVESMNVTAGEGGLPPCIDRQEGCNWKECECTGSTLCELGHSTRCDPIIGSCAGICEMQMDNNVIIGIVVGVVALLICCTCLKCLWHRCMRPSPPEMVVRVQHYQSLV